MEFEVNYPEFTVTCSLRQKWGMETTKVKVELYRSDSRMGDPDIEVSKSIDSSEKSVEITGNFSEEFEIGSTFSYTVSAIAMSESKNPQCVHVSGEQVVRKGNIIIL